MSSSDLVQTNPDQLQQLSTDELKKEFFSSLDITVRHFQHMANIWRILEERGEDMAQYRDGIAIYIEMIAHNRLDANLVVKYAGRKALLNALSRIPIDKQKDIAENDEIEIARIGDDDEISSEKVKLSLLPTADIYDVIDDKGIRSVAEQQRILVKREGKGKSKKRKQRKARKVEINSKEKTLQVGPTIVDLDKVVEALSKYYDIDIKKLKDQADGE